MMVLTLIREQTFQSIFSRDGSLHQTALFEVENHRTGRKYRVLGDLGKYSLDRGKT